MAAVDVLMVPFSGINSHDGVSQCTHYLVANCGIKQWAADNKMIINITKNQENCLCQVRSIFLPLLRSVILNKYNQCTLGLILKHNLSFVEHAPTVLFLDVAASVLILLRLGLLGDQGMSQIYVWILYFMRLLYLRFGMLCVPVAAERNAQCFSL